MTVMTDLGGRILRWSKRSIFGNGYDVVDAIFWIRGGRYYCLCLSRFSKITGSTISPQKMHLHPENCSLAP